MCFPDGALFLPPTLPPAPLCPPPGAERGALIWLRRAGYASTARKVATVVECLHWHAIGRRELAPISTPPLAAAPASNETNHAHGPNCLAHGRPQSGRRRWHVKVAPFTTTAGKQSWLTSNHGDASLHRSLSKTPKAKSRLPSLPPAGGKEGRGDDWGVVKRLAREKASANTEREK